MKKFNLFTLFLIAFTTINAQQQSSVTLRLNSLIPNGDFKDDDYEDFLFDGAGGAATGLGLGLEFAKEVQIENLSILGSIDFLVNGLSNETTNNIEDDLDPEDQVKYLKYLNIPVLLGAKYVIQTTNIGIYGRFGVGLDYMKITNFVIEYDFDGATNTLSFDNSLKLAFGVGAGILVNDKITLGFDYLGLGTHPIDGKDTYEANSYSNEEDISDYYETRDISISGIKLHVGLVF